MAAAAFPLELVENHLTSLRRLAQLLVRDPNDAEDVVQETWLMALRSRPSGLHRLRGWLETVLRNVVRRRRRQQRRSQIRERSVARRDSVPPAVDVVMRQQHLASLTDAIRELPVELQECVFLRSGAVELEGPEPCRPVIGVYQDLMVRSLIDKGGWSVTWPLPLQTEGLRGILVRVDGDATDVVQPIRDRLAALSGDIRYVHVLPMTSRVEAMRGPWRVGTSSHFA